MTTPVLFLSYYFPPLGGAGVQRSAKFVRYLPELGFTPTVVAGPAEGRGRWERCTQGTLRTSVGRPPRQR